MTEQVSRKLQIFRSSMASIQYIFHGMSLNSQGARVPNGIIGKAAVFMAGEYRTDVKEEIDELNEEIRLKHPFLFRDPERMEMDAEDVDPLVKLKKQHFKEFMAEQERAKTHVSTSDSSKSGAGTGVATSAGLDGAKDSNSVPGAGLKINLPFKQVP